MDEPWFQEVADELARCIVDAHACAEACERLLEAAASNSDAVVRRAVARTVIAPAAVARTLAELVELSRPLTLGAAALCRDAARDAVPVLESLAGPLDTAAAVAALHVCARSCDALLET